MRLWFLLHPISWYMGQWAFLEGGLFNNCSPKQRTLRNSIPNIEKMVPIFTRLVNTEESVIFTVVPCWSLWDLWKPVKKGPSCHGVSRSQVTEHSGQRTLVFQPLIWNKGERSLGNSPPLPAPPLPSPAEQWQTFCFGCDGLRSRSVPRKEAAK